VTILKKDPPEGGLAPENQPASSEAPDVPPEHVLLSSSGNTRLYNLRHTCATLLLNSNVHPKYAQELLGHASIAQKLDTYSHVLKGMDGGIGSAMDEALG
jgi:integrase